MLRGKQHGTSVVIIVACGPVFTVNVQRMAFDISCVEAIFAQLLARACSVEASQLMASCDNGFTRCVSYTALILKDLEHTWQKCANGDLFPLLTHRLIYL